METESFANRDWQVTRSPDGTLPDSQITHALLMDVRSELKGTRELLSNVRGMLVFFTVLVVIGLVVGVLLVLAR